MVVAAPAALEFALLCDLEAPGSALMGLHLRHLSSSAFSLCPTVKRDSRHGSSRFASEYSLDAPDMSPRTPPQDHPSPTWGAIVSKSYVNRGWRSPDADPRPSEPRPSSGPRP